MSRPRIQAVHPSQNTTAKHITIGRTLFALLQIILLTSCAKETATPAVSVPSTHEPSHAPEIRFALIGEVTEGNVWALFDAKGYSYNNRAIRAAYWPRLYELTIPDGEYQAVTANGMPSPMRKEGAYVTATVPLHSNLHWSDGFPFTAEDIAFTVNTALGFRLGFDWHDYYDPTWLDHAEAVDALTVKYFYRGAPNPRVWQYGTLQGPIVSERYWASKITEAASKLPSKELSSEMDALRTNITTLQEQVNTLYTALLTAQGEQARQLQADLRRQQGNLDKATNDLAKNQTKLDEALNAAREELYAIDDADEPRLGRWEAGTKQTIPNSGTTYVNEANTDFPGTPPNFDRAQYITYSTREAADAALANASVDIILDPVPPALSDATSAQMTSPSRSLRFLVFNQKKEAFSKAALRQALACILDQRTLAALLAGGGIPLTSFVLPEETSWFNVDAHLPCDGSDDATRLAEAINILKAKGYTWKQEPSADLPGEGLTTPSGDVLAAMQLLTPESDELRSAAADYIQQQANLLGIPLMKLPVTQEELDYAVFSSHRYDSALLGWRISAYPGYLCNWFGSQQPFEYLPRPLNSSCAELESTSDLAEAGGLIRTIQATLAQDVPMVPLFSGVSLDRFHGVGYPFTRIPDGLSSVFGAPSLAFPVIP